MTPPNEHVYRAAPAEIARAAARSANDVSAVSPESDDRAPPRKPAAPAPSFPLRSIAKWTPIER